MGKSISKESKQAKRALSLSYLGFALITIAVVVPLAALVWLMMSFEDSFAGCSGYFAGLHAGRVASFAHAIPTPPGTTIVSGPQGYCRTRGLGAVHSVVYNLRVSSPAEYVAGETFYERYLKKKGLSLVSVQDDQVYMTHSNGHAVDMAFIMIPTTPMSDGRNTISTLAAIAARAGQFTYAITVQDADQ